MTHEDDFMTTSKETIESLYDALARGDVATVLGLLAPDVNWIEAEGFPYGGTYVGPQAVLQNVFARLGAEWSSFTAVPAQLVAEGETVVALGTYSGTYTATGKKMTVPFAHVWKLQRGKVVTFQQHTDTAVVQRALK